MRACWPPPGDKRPALWAQCRPCQVQVPCRHRCDGTVVIPNLFEGSHEIHAQKFSHSSFRRSIFLETPGTAVEAFLQFEAVSYTFSVVKVPVSDQYEIVEETKF